MSAGLTRHRKGMMLNIEMEPTPPVAAAPHLVATRLLCALSATRGGAAPLAPFGGFNCSLTPICHTF
jgi:hypothetical protein